MEKQHGVLAVTINNIRRGDTHRPGYPTLDALSAGLGISPESPVHQLIINMGRGRNTAPVGLMLEHYVDSGGTDFRTFLQSCPYTLEEMSTLTGILPASISRTMLASNIERRGPLVEKFINGFQLKTAKQSISRQERLFWFLARGNKDLPSVNEIVLAGLAALQQGEDAKEVAHTTFARLLDKSGFTHDKFAPLAGSNRKTIERLSRGEIDLPNHPDAAFADRLAEALIPRDISLSHLASNVFLGIAEEKSDEQLLEETKRGDITVGGFIRTVRRYYRETQEEFGKNIPYQAPGASYRGVRPLSVYNWERGQLVAYRNRELGEAVAQYLGLHKPADIADFVALASEPARTAHGPAPDSQLVVGPATAQIAGRADSTKFIA